MPTNIELKNTIHIKNRLIVDSTINADYAWQHYDLSNQLEYDSLNNNTAIPDFVRTALITRETRPRVETIDDGLLIILRGVNLNPDEDHDDMVSLRIWAQKDLIITAQYRKLQTTSEFWKRAQSSSAEPSVSVLLAKIISTLFQKIEDTVLELADTIDDLEEQVSGPISAEVREKIATQRHAIVAFKRHLLPQREVVSQLRYSNLDWLHDNHRNYHNENYERVMRNVEDLEMMRDKLNIIKEEVQYLLSERLNKNMYVLSIVTTIFLPLGFLTGLLGINISGIPGSEYSNAFWVFCGILAVVVIIQLIIFKKKKWL